MPDASTLPPAPGERRSPRLVFTFRDADPGMQAAGVRFWIYRNNAGPVGDVFRSLDDYRWHWTLYGHGAPNKQGTAPTLTDAEQMIELLDAVEATQGATMRPTGLPIASIEPLTAKEREALRDLARALRLSADRVDEALETGRVDRGMEACNFVGELGTIAQRAAAVLGSGR
jgi:antitoxin (DNA-binding transcriptional repressor) of toxin-antitoxin stability system